MKKYMTILVLFFAIGSQVFGAINMLSRFGPTLSTAEVTLASAGASARNCLKNIDATSDNDFTLRVLDGGTTVYTLAASSGSVIIRSWDADDLFCGTANTQMQIKISNGNFRINYSGFTY